MTGHDDARRGGPDRGVPGEDPLVERLRGAFDGPVPPMGVDAADARRRGTRRRTARTVLRSTVGVAGVGAVGVVLALVAGLPQLGAGDDVAGSGPFTTMPSTTTAPAPPASPLPTLDGTGAAAVTRSPAAGVVTVVAPGPTSADGVTELGTWSGAHVTLSRDGADASLSAVRTDALLSRPAPAPLAGAAHGTGSVWTGAFADPSAGVLFLGQAPAGSRVVLWTWRFVGGETSSHAQPVAVVLPTFALPAVPQVAPAGERWFAAGLFGSAAAVFTEHSHPQGTFALPRGPGGAEPARWDVVVVAPDGTQTSVACGPHDTASCTPPAAQAAVLDALADASDAADAATLRAKAGAARQRAAAAAAAGRSDAAAASKAASAHTATGTGSGGEASVPASAPPPAAACRPQDAQQTGTPGPTPATLAPHVLAATGPFRSGGSGESVPLGVFAGAAITLDRSGDGDPSVRLVGRCGEDVIEYPASGVTGEAPGVAFSTFDDSRHGYFFFGVVPAAAPRAFVWLPATSAQAAVVREVPTFRLPTVAGSPVSADRRWFAVDVADPAGDGSWASEVGGVVFAAPDGSVVEPPCTRTHPTCSTPDVATLAAVRAALTKPAAPVG